MESVIQPGERPATEDIFNAPRWFYVLIAASMITAGGLRIMLYLESRGGPLTATHRHDMADMGIFHEWALRIAQGDWTGAHTFHPWRPAHGVMAENYFKLRPDRLPEMEAKAKATGHTVPQLLWFEWMGGENIFEREPLYAYIMAAIYTLFGPDPAYVFIFQIALGVATVPIIILLTRRLFGEKAAVFAAALVALDGTLLWQDIILIRTTFTIFLSASAVLVSIWALDGGSPKRGFAAGLVYGAGYLTQAYFPMCAALFAGWWVYRDRAAGRRPYAALAAFAAGFLLPLAPLVARNLAYGAPPFSVVNSRMYYFIQSNSPDFDPFQPFNLSTPYIPVIIAKAGLSPIKIFMETVAMHESAGSFVSMMAQKALAAMAPFPPPDNGLFYAYYRSHLLALRLAPAHFVLIAPLALAGIIIHRHRLRDAVPAFILAGVFIFTMIVFVTFDRYRIPLEALAIPFAASALAWIVQALGGKRGVAAVILAGVAYASVFTVGKVGHEAYLFSARIYYRPAIAQWMNAGNHAEAARVFSRWFEYEDNFGVRPGRISKDQAKLARWYAGLLMEQSAAFKLAGMEAESGKSGLLAREIMDELASKGFFQAGP